MEPISPSKVKIPIVGCLQFRRSSKFYVISMLVPLILLVGMYLVVYKPQDASKRSYFTVIVDCGSTGTRVNVYEFENIGLNYWDLPELVHSYPDNSTMSGLTRGSCRYHCMQTEPGLDKFVYNSSGVRLSLEPLMQWAEKVVPMDKHGVTPVFVLATAGLRRLVVKDARWVLEEADAVVKEYRFIHRKEWIRVLSGKEEAFYGWVALNYRMGRFDNSLRLPTLGLLDLGGSSLQVVMEVDELRGDIHFMRSRIGRFEHKIVAYSLPSFGTNAAFDRAVVMLSHATMQTESIDGIFEVRHPCLSSNFMHNYTCTGCFQQNTTVRERIGQSSLVYLVGNPNWEECKKLARATAINSSNSDWSKLASGSNLKGSLSSHKGNNILNFTGGQLSSRFHALSGFFIVYNLLNLNPRANLTKVWESGQQLCSKSWSDLNSSFSIQNYAGLFCFRLSYILSLIEDALCLKDKEMIFGPPDISWTLGAALVEGKFLWLNTAQAEPGFWTLSSKVVSSPVLIFVLLVILSLIVYCSQLKLPMPGKKADAVISLPSYANTRRRPN